jgi:hypothetical protein
MDDIVHRFVIEQNEGNPGSSFKKRVTYNSVQKYLSSLSLKNNLHYEIVSWGDPKDQNKWLQGAPFNEHASGRLRPKDSPEDRDSR